MSVIWFIGVIPILDGHMALYVIAGSNIHLNNIEYIGLMLRGSNGMYLPIMTSQTYPMNKERKMKINELKIGQLVRAKYAPTRIGIILQLLPVGSGWTSNTIQVLWLGGFNKGIENRWSGDLVNYCNDSNKLQSI